MESKKLVCKNCSESKDIIKDSFTGMWELMVGYASISNMSWEFIEKTWLELHRRECHGVAGTS